MELQTRLSVSVLLLSLAVMGLNASPVPISLLSRLRRSASDATEVPTVATTEESVSGASASPSARVARQASSQPSVDHVTLSSHYAHLHVDVTEIAREHRGLYSDYKRERFAEEANPMVRDLVLSYLPSVHDLSHEDIRAALPDSELVTVHYNNLIIFRDTLGRVRDSETPDYSARVGTVIEMLRSVITRIETTMLLHGNEDSIIRNQPSIREFHSNVTDQERDMRTLFVLQEFHYYMPHVRRDFRILNNRHLSE